MKRILIFILLFSGGQILGQSAISLVEQEKELSKLLTNLRSAKGNEEKGQANLLFKNALKTAIQSEGAFQYPFELLTTVGTIASPDSVFRLFNWNIEQDDFTQKYECFILKFDDRRKEYEIIELTENTDIFAGRSTEIIDASNWYGALYYEIIPVEKGSRQMYTVLGWDGNDQSSSIKLIDVMYFTGSTVKLGSPIFKTKTETLKRVYFEHSKNATMSLRYEEKYDRIIFDHLSPESPSLEGFYMYYVPDMSYDAFVFKNNKWNLVEDVVGINKKKEDKITVSVFDESSGGTKEIKIKNKWENPSDENAPAGGSVHVAVSPQEEVDSKKDKKNRTAKKDKSGKGKKPKSNIRN